MKLKQLLEQLNQLAKERPEALEMEVLLYDEIEKTSSNLIEVSILSKMNYHINKIETFIKFTGNKYE